MPIESIDSRRLYRQIADQLNQLIASGEYRPGDRLPAERALAQQLKVSRPSVREALIALEVEGIVEIRGGAGVFVVDRTSSQSVETEQIAIPGPFEVLAARDLLEPEIAALAAKSANADQIKAIAAALGEMACCSATDPTRIEYDRLFHFNLAEACGNSALALMVQTLWGPRTDPLYIKLEDHFHTEAIWQNTIIEHREILEAVRMHDPKAAREAMRRHIRRAEKRFASNWQSTGRT